MRNIEVVQQMIDCVIFQAEKMARLFLTDLVQTILCEACGLLGMECSREMKNRY